MSTEMITRSLSFDALYVEVTVCRYICDRCSRRECFHESPEAPAGTKSASACGWQPLIGHDDGEQEWICPKCSTPPPE